MYLLNERGEQVSGDGGWELKSARPRTSSHATRGLMAKREVLTPSTKVQCSQILVLEEIFAGDLLIIWMSLAKVVKSYGTIRSHR